MTTIRIARAPLAAAINLGASIVAEKPSVEVLGNVRLSVANGEASLAFTDLETWLSTKLPADADAITATTLPAGLFAKVLSSLEASEVTLKLDQGRAVLTGGRAKFNLPMLPSDQFPMPSEPETSDGEAHLDAGAVADAIESVAYCAGDGILNPATLRFLFSAGGEVTLASFEGTRLALDDLRNQGSAIEPFSLNAKAARTLARICKASPSGGLTVRLSERAAHFETAAWRMRASLANDKFPTYEASIDALSRAPHEIQFEAKAMDAALARMSLLADKYSEAARIELSEDKAVISLSNSKIGNASEEVSIAYSGPERTVAFRLSYLRDALKQVKTDQAELRIDAQNRGLVMPLGNQSTSIHSIGPYAI